MTSSKRDQVVSAVAWLFALGSLAPVYWSLRGDGGAYYIMHVGYGEWAFKSFALACEGPTGKWLAGGQFVAVAGAALLSALPFRWPRRIGLLVLCAWCGLWLYNAVYRSLLAPVWPAFVIAAAALLFFACTLARAVREWPARADQIPGDCDAARSVTPGSEPTDAEPAMS